MPLKTRQNPQTGVLEVLVDNEWMRFQDFRDRQIQNAYRNSIKFLRERLEVDPEDETEQKSGDVDAAN